MDSDTGEEIDAPGGGNGFSVPLKRSAGANGRRAEFMWDSDVDLDFVHSADVHCVVVWRENHVTIVATPIYVWGTAPSIELHEKPTHAALGKAVLTQIRHSIMEKRKHETV